MTNTSKQILANEDHERLAAQFVHFIKGEFGHAQFDELFTPAEQMMFIKRLAAIIMLETGYSRYRIARTLQLSENTVKKYAHAHQSGRYDHLVRRARNKKFNQKEFWSIIEKLLRAGLPPMAGPGRWKKIAPAAVRRTTSH